MPILIQPDAVAASRVAADLVVRLVRRKPDAVLGLAAGATPLAMYAELLRRHRAGEVDLSGITVFGLDEYLGVGADHPAGCVSILRRNFIDPLGLPAARVRLFDGLFSGDLATYCAAHEDAIAAAGGLDLQILGLGVNGHVGFNEPGCSLAGRTQVLALRSTTLRTNGPLFAKLGQEIPRTAISIGVGTIRDARRVLLLATGLAKADAAAKAIEGPVTATVPASALQMHPDATWVLDEAAASRLVLRDDYEAEASLVSGVAV